ncbi:hypothetical protein [Bacillus phage phiAGATE]|uniref:Uncharacterized protein n=1 Tax=Bacillus phage phiAGATE TaxID=1204533 RepID=L0LC76_9CAUD|nr:hypothetical protein G380_gp041 [Bacillus phage phiAGATE]AGB62691.1 hypothetical protein [Bacillus phage phiAGATE]
MKKVKITLRGGGALEWTPKNKTKNILGLWNWMSRTQVETAILNFKEGGVRISEIAAMEYIEEPPVELSYFDDEQEEEEKVRLTLWDGRVLYWAPIGKTKNILEFLIGHSNPNRKPLHRDKSDNLTFVEGELHPYDISAIERVGVVDQEELSSIDEQFARAVVEVDKTTSRGDDEVQEYREIKGIVYANSEEPFTDINSFPRFDVYPSLVSLVATLGYGSKEEELVSNGFIFAEITCRVPLSEFKRFEEGNWVLVNREDVLSEDIRFEDSYELKPGQVNTMRYLATDYRDKTVTVYAKEPDRVCESLRYHRVCALVPVMSSSLEEIGRVHVPCYHVAKAHLGES